jgi:hypothetical protein
LALALTLAFWRGRQARLNLVDRRVDAVHFLRRGGGGDCAGDASAAQEAGAQRATTEQGAQA